VAPRLSTPLASKHDSVQSGQTPGRALDLRDSSEVVGDEGGGNYSELQLPVNGLQAYNGRFTNARSLLDLQWSTTLDRGRRTGPPIVSEL
jgi:hypothetical protein